MDVSTSKGLRETGTEMAPTRRAVAHEQHLDNSMQADGSAQGAPGRDGRFDSAHCHQWSVRPAWTQKPKAGHLNSHTRAQEHTMNQHSEEVWYSVFRTAADNKGPAEAEKLLRELASLVKKGAWAPQDPDFQGWHKRYGNEEN